MGASMKMVSVALLMLVMALIFIEYPAALLRG